MYPFLCKFRKRGTYHREAAVFIYKIRVSNSVLAILLGLALLIWPADALKYVVMLIGIVFLAIGIIAFIISSRNREEHKNGRKSRRQTYQQ